MLSLMKPVRPVLAALLALALGGCNLVVMAPSGDIAAQQRDILVISTLLMLVIIIPVMALVVLFAWRYRQSNTEAQYDPDWHHSTKLELVIWAVPLLIIICLGAVTWMGTHLLDAYRPIGRIAADRAVPADAKPLEVQVVSLDWKWLFIYPEYGIASVNVMAAPTDRPVQFRLTSSSVMNAFYIPALAGMIYTMPAMETKLHAVINHEGDYEGFSANYSGHGFSGMRFTFHGLSHEGFEEWVAKAKASGQNLTREDYLALERPSFNEQPRLFAGVDPMLFNAVVNMCVEPGKMCMSEMMAIDAKGGLGLAGVANTLPLTYDKHARRGAVFGAEKSYVAAICKPEDALSYASSSPQAPDRLTPILGHGLSRSAKPAASLTTSDKAPDPARNML